MSALSLLTCNHTVFGNPMIVGSETYCARCERVSIVQASAYEYRARCTRCTFSRGAGSSRMLAESYAIRHGKRNRHDVTVRLEDFVVSTFHFAARVESDIPLF